MANARHSILDLPNNFCPSFGANSPPIKNRNIVATPPKPVLPPCNSQPNGEDQLIVSEETGSVVVGFLTAFVSVSIRAVLAFRKLASACFKSSLISGFRGSSADCFFKLAISFFKRFTFNCCSPHLLIDSTHPRMRRGKLRASLRPFVRPLPAANKILGTINHRFFNCLNPPKLFEAAAYNKIRASQITQTSTITAPNKVAPIPSKNFLFLINVIIDPCSKEKCFNSSLSPAILAIHMDVSCRAIYPAVPNIPIPIVIGNA